MNRGSVAPTTAPAPLQPAVPFEPRRETVDDPAIRSWSGRSPLSRSSRSAAPGFDVRTSAKSA